MKRPLTRLGTSTRVPSNARSKSPSAGAEFEPYFTGSNVLTDPEFENFRDNSGGWYWWDREGGETRYTLPYLDLDCPSFLLWPDGTCTDTLLVGWCQSSGPYELEEPPTPIDPPPAGDTTPPAVPTGLTIIAGDTQAILDWNNNVESDFASYRAYRATASAGPYAFIISRAVSDYVSTGLTNGTQYWFKLSAVDTTGNESAMSAAVSVTPTAPTPGDVTPPPVPTGLTATAGDRLVILDWDNNAASDFASFNVKRATVSGGPYTTIISRTASDYTNTGLTNGTTYFYVISAVDTSGNESANSSQASATPVFVPDPDPPPPGPGPGTDSYPRYADRQATINVGDDFDTVISAWPVGTLFGVAPGIHNFTSVGDQFTLRIGDRFVGQTDANEVPTSFIKGNWDGSQGGTGLKGPWLQLDNNLPNDIQLYRIDFSYFAPELQQTSIGGGINWIMHNCWIHHMKSGGARVGSGGLISGGKIYRCGQIGLKSSTAANGGVVDGTEIFENNYWGWATIGYEAGGMKFAGGSPTNMVIRNCHFHHNVGAGLWYDAAGAGGIIEDNLCEYNEKAGLFYELSSGAGCIIRRNVVTLNGGAADLYIANSAGASGNPIIVENNEVYSLRGSFGNHAGIWLKDDPNRSPRLAHVTVRGNLVRREIVPDRNNIATGHFGSTTTPTGVIWNDNDYEVESGVSWQWLTVKKTWSQWQALGFDLTGSQTII